MIPSDVASRLQLTTDASIPRVPTVQQVTDALADLVPGQRVLAEIQALLPNGAYRALINQRDITLALPFSAKAGDALELEVVDNDGKLALAVVAKRTAGAEAAGERPAVETTLSRTGNFIAGLLAKGEDGAAAKPTVLNANQPLAAAPPASGEELVQLLKQAIAQSGMFYEAHQSRWLNQQLPTAALLAEPQGRLSPQPREAAPGLPGSGGMALADGSAAGQMIGEAPAGGDAAAPTGAGATAAGDAGEAAPATATAESSAARAAAAAGPLVAPELAPLVQQQLEALASQTYSWQGQAWPGQTMQWEIVEEDGPRQPEEDAGPLPWQTRLKLTMPNLGEVRAALRIVAGELTLSLSAGDGDAAAQLANGGDGLRRQLEAAGLQLNGFSVGRHDQPAE